MLPSSPSPLNLDCRSCSFFNPPLPRVRPPRRPSPLALRPPPLPSHQLSQMACLMSPMPRPLPISTPAQGLAPAAFPTSGGGHAQSPLETYPALIHRLDGSYLLPFSAAVPPGHSSPPMHLPVSRLRVSLATQHRHRLLQFALEQYRTATSNTSLSASLGLAALQTPGKNKSSLPMNGMKEVLGMSLHYDIQRRRQVLTIFSAASPCRPPPVTCDDGNSVSSSSSRFCAVLTNPDSYSR